MILAVRAVALQRTSRQARMPTGWPSDFRLRLVKRLTCLDVESRHLVARVEDESFWLCLPGFADEFVGRETFTGLEAFGEIVGLNEVGEMAAELIVGIVKEAPDGCVLDGAVHSLDLAVSPGMPWLSQSVIDVGEGAGVFKSVRSERLTFRDHLADFGGGPGFTLRIGANDGLVLDEEDG